MRKLYQSGFTLTELILVVVILGILSAAAMPRFMDIQIFESRGFHEEVLSALRHAQKMAVGTGCKIQVTITTSPAPGSYTLNRETECNNDTFTGAAIENPSTGNPYPTTAPDSAAFSNVNFFPIVFNRLGQANNSGVAQTTASVDVGGRTITIWQETGLVTELP